MNRQYYLGRDCPILTTDLYLMAEFLTLKIHQPVETLSVPAKPIRSYDGRETKPVSPALIQARL